MGGMNETNANSAGKPLAKRVAVVTARITIRTDALIAKMPRSKMAKTTVLSRVPRSTGRFSIWARSLAIGRASNPFRGVLPYPLPDRG